MDPEIYQKPLLKNTIGIEDFWSKKRFFMTEKKPILLKRRLLKI